jgi:hypothetical protein
MSLEQVSQRLMLSKATISTANDESSRK